ncbi:MAG: serine/threonine protein kinase [Deltaproteobacteria bacterium]|nr:serine/threonine protein kinase [Deltaproteobacteria bacterium]
MQDASRYRLLDRLAAGATSEVFRAERLGPDGTVTLVAYKRGLPQLAEADAIAREANVLRALSHRCIARLVDSGESADGAFLVVELIDGIDLATLLEAPLTSGAAARVCAEVARALAHTHEAGWVHGDVSPENVMISTLGEVKLTDFGSAVRVGERPVALGKHGFSAPEIERRRPLDTRADIYGLGALLSSALAGMSGDLARSSTAIARILKLPDPALRSFSAKDVADLLEAQGADDPGSKLELEELVRRAASRGPAAADALAAELLGVLDPPKQPRTAMVRHAEATDEPTRVERAETEETTIEAPQLTRPEARRPVPERRSTLLALSLLGLALLLGAAASWGASLWSRSQDNLAPPPRANAIHEAPQDAPEPRDAQPASSAEASASAGAAAPFEPAAPAILDASVPSAPHAAPVKRTRTKATSKSAARRRAASEVKSRSR